MRQDNKTGHRVLEQARPGITLLYIMYIIGTQLTGVASDAAEQLAGGQVVEHQGDGLEDG
jgi:hypothetical protein